MMWVDDDGDDHYEIRVSGHSANMGGSTILSGKIKDLVAMPALRQAIGPESYHDFEEAMKSLVFGGDR
jgi:hypothetical protein